MPIFYGIGFATSLEFQASPARHAPPFSEFPGSTDHWTQMVDRSCFYSTSEIKRGNLGLSTVLSCFQPKRTFFTMSKIHSWSGRFWSPKVIPRRPATLGLTFVDSGTCLMRESGAIWWCGLAGHICTTDPLISLINTEFYVALASRAIFQHMTWKKNYEKLTSPPFYGFLKTTYRPFAYPILEYVWIGILLILIEHLSVATLS